MFGFAGSGPDTPAGVAGDGEPTGGGAFTEGFSSADSSGSDGLIEMRGLSFNDGGFAASVPAADGGGGDWHRRRRPVRSLVRTKLQLQPRLLAGRGAVAHASANLTRNHPNETKKMRSRSKEGSSTTSLKTDTMKSFVPAALVLALALATGCSLFHKKEKKLVTPALPPAAEIQADFRDRWVDRRTHELLAAGTAKTEEEARAMAAADFAKQNPFINPPANRTGR
jgi:hypothetical protein